MMKLYLWKIMNYYAGSYEKIEENLFCNWNKRLSMKKWKFKWKRSEESLIETREIYFNSITNLTEE